MAQEITGRRQFLKSAGAAGLTTALFTGNLRSANDRVNVAFIGTGRIGSINMEYAASVPGVQIVSLCDVSRPTLEKAATHARMLGLAGVKAVQDFREILADRSVDVVSIAAPGHCHASLTVEACKSNKDVWLEEPACVCVEEGVRMVEAARKYQRVVQAGTMARSGAFFQKAREIVSSGELGEITFCRASQASGHPAPDVHLLDFVQFAFNEAMPLSVSAQASRSDTMRATYRYPGFILSYESANDAPGGISFHGTRATLMVNRQGYSVFPNAMGAAPRVEKSKAMAEMHVPHWKNFLDCVRSRRKPISDIETCVRSTVSCILANVSLRHGVTVKQRELQPYLKLEV